MRVCERECCDREHVCTQSERACCECVHVCASVEIVNMCVNVSVANVYMCASVEIVYMCVYVSVAISRRGCIAA